MSTEANRELSTVDRMRSTIKALTAVAVLLLVAVVVLAVLAVKWHGQAGDTGDDAKTGEAALKTARADLADITTYSYKDIDKDFGWLDDFTDEKVSAPFAKNQKALAKVVKGTKTVAQGKVLDAMSRVVGPEQVEVMAFVDQVLKDGKNKGYKVEQQRVSMTMRLVGGSWKIDRLNLLGGNNAT